MKEKLSRKDLKRNDLVESYNRTVDYVTSHRRGVVEAAAVAAAIALVVAGFFLVKLYRERRSGGELSAGLAALQAPLATEPGASTAPQTFASTEARDRAADEHFRKAASYGGTTPARAAAVILAARSEKAGAAAETFARAARDGRAEIAAAAEIDAARLLVSQGKTADAVDRLKRAIESPAATLPKDALLFALAQVYEASGATSDARATYQRIVNDYPNSPYRADARSLSGAAQ
ncbi:MAG: tetratricopeptide repeat protein [Acidobacteriota bacterium]